jgi:hypothetical protein
MVLKVNQNSARRSRILRQFALTSPAYDPTAKIPEYKICGVKVEKAAWGTATAPGFTKQ